MAKSDPTKNDSATPSKIDDKIDTLLLEQRRLFLCDAIDNDSAQEIIRKLWYLEAKDPGKLITLVINSPGGSIDAGFAIWDQIKMLSSPVATLVTGLAASMGSILSLAASPKLRFATPYSRFMVHQPRLGGVIQGQATDLEIQAREILKTRRILIDLYVKATGRNSAAIEKAIDRDTWMTAEEAREFGLLDAIITNYEDMNKYL